MTSPRRATPTMRQVFGGVKSESSSSKRNKAECCELPTCLSGRTDVFDDARYGSQQIEAALAAYPARDREPRPPAIAGSVGSTDLYRGADEACGARHRRRRALARRHGRDHRCLCHEPVAGRATVRDRQTQAPEAALVRNAMVLAHRRSLQADEGLAECRLTIAATSRRSSHPQCRSNEQRSASSASGMVSAVANGALWRKLISLA